MNYKQLHRKAEKLGISLSRSGGYYYMSSSYYGKRRQGIFQSLNAVKLQLDEEERKMGKYKEVKGRNVDGSSNYIYVLK